MVRTVSIERIKKNLKTSGFFLNCKIPIGYTAGFPILQVRNESLCILFPYLKYQTTGEIDRTLVFPVRYGILMELPTEKIIGFEDYEYREIFKNIDFNKPVGFFRHDAVKKYNREQYKTLYDELMKEYDKVINALLGNGNYSFDDERRMRELLQILIEPSLLSVYQAIDMDFYYKYLSKGDESYGI